MGLFSGLKSSLGSIGSVVGSVFGGPVGSAIGSSIGSSLSDDYVYRRQLKDQYRLIDYQNEYNNPVQQMQRLKQAGLNPNLIYNNGSAVVTSASGSIPKYVRDMEVQNLRGMSLQNDLLEAQRDNTFWQAGMSQHNAVKTLADSKIAQYNEEYARREYEIFKRTGKIPETYQRSNALGELTGLVKGFLTDIFN